MDDEEDVEGKDVKRKGVKGKDAEEKDAEGKPLRVLYISPSPPPKVQGTDGLFSEIGYLREFFGGDMIGISPARALLH
jgi:hypothetical protein